MQTCCLQPSPTLPRAPNYSRIVSYGVDCIAFDIARSI